MLGTDIGVSERLPCCLPGFALYDLNMLGMDIDVSERLPFCLPGFALYDRNMLSTDIGVSEGLHALTFCFYLSLSVCLFLFFSLTASQEPEAEENSA
jgi:hypothetical protein